MTRRPTWLSATAIGGAIALLAVSSAPVLAQATPEPPPEGGYTVYPNYGDGVTCGMDGEPGSFNGMEYTGNIKSIEAVDDLTVVFTLCSPDPAFLPKIAFSAFAISDADYLAANATNGSLIDQPNGTGPYMLDEWRRGEELILTAFPDYWGDPVLTETVVMRWSSESGQKLIELQSGQVDGIDNPSGDDLATIEADPDLVVHPRDGQNVFYIGTNNTFPPFDNEKIRQALAMGIDRQAIVDQFYPPGSSVADYFTPCSYAFACGGEPWYDFDPEAARALLAEGMAEAGIETFPEVPIHLRIVDRAYLPFPDQVAVEIQNQLMENLGIPAVIDQQESGTLIDNTNNGRLPGLLLLGWNADFPDATNFMDFHFGPGAGPRFGDGWPDIHDALIRGGSSADPAVREQAYTDANNALREHVPVIPIARGGSATAWRADVEGSHSSPLANEEFRVVGPGSDDVLVFMQNAEPIGLFCADETDGESLRACEQISESLYGYEIAGAAPIPRLAEECTSNEDLTVWTCTLREGVTFHDGSELTAHDVVTSYALAWDAANPLHVGRSGTFTYTSGLWGGFLNPPPPAEE